jgi:hypothetical protein
MLEETMKSEDGQQHLSRLLSTGEGIRVEYKEAKSALPTKLFETVCAMLNRDGSVFRTVIPLPATSESVGKDFRVKFRENFRVKFGVTGKRLDRMTDMVVGLSTGEILVVERLSKEYGVSERTIHEDLGRLKQWDIVRFEGPPKTGTYVLTGKGKAMLEGAI